MSSYSTGITFDLLVNSWGPRVCKFGRPLLTRDEDHDDSTGSNFFLLMDQNFAYLHGRLFGCLVGWPWLKCVPTRDGRLTSGWQQIWLYISWWLNAVHSHRFSGRNEMWTCESLPICLIVCKLWRPSLLERQIWAQFGGCILMSNAWHSASRSAGQSANRSAQNMQIINSLEIQIWFQIWNYYYYIWFFVLFWFAKIYLNQSNYKIKTKHAFRLDIENKSSLFRTRCSKFDHLHRIHQSYNAIVNARLWAYDSTIRHHTRIESFRLYSLDRMLL